MSRYKKVADHPDYVKDQLTGMILNINKDNSEARKARAIREQRQKEREELETLKSDVHDIKVMLQKLLENGTNG